MNCLQLNILNYLFKAWSILGLHFEHFLYYFRQFTIILNFELIQSRFNFPQIKFLQPPLIIINMLQIPRLQQYHSQYIYIRFLLLIIIKIIFLNQINQLRRYIQNWLITIIILIPHQRQIILRTVNDYSIS